MVTRDMGTSAFPRWVMGTRNRWPSGATSKRVPTDEVFAHNEQGLWKARFELSAVDLQLDRIRRGVKQASEK